MVNTIDTIFENLLSEGKKNFVLLGEAGSGKSEIALNLAIYFACRSPKPVHFFDLDMTKPLLRSRESEKELAEAKVTVHYQDQFLDAPVLVNGVKRSLKDADIITVLDVGGDHIGARSIGGFQEILNQEATEVWYVVNGYRPWSLDLANINRTLGEILAVTHLKENKFRLINNSNLGAETTANDFVEGTDKIRAILGPDVSFFFSTASRAVYADLPDKNLIFPLDLYVNIDRLL